MKRNQGARRSSPDLSGRAIFLLCLYFAAFHVPAMTAEETPGETLLPEYLDERFFPDTPDPKQQAPFNIDAPPKQGAPSTYAYVKTDLKGAFPRFNWEVSLLFGLTFGQSEEIVYKNSGEKLSQLLWDLKPLVYAGGNLYFELGDRFQEIASFGNLEMQFGFPMKTGVMEDRDWTNVNNKLTHYSIHESYAENAVALDLETGLAFPLNIGPFKPILKGTLGISYMRYFWSGQDGYGEYASGKIDFSGTVITYDQRWFILNPGIGLEAPFLRRFSAALSFRISPLVWCVSEDHHKTTSTKYLDIMSSISNGAPWGIYLEPQGSITFSPNSRVSITLYCSYRNISGVQGVSYSRSTKPGSSGIYSLVDNLCGAGYSAFDGGIKASLRF